MSKAFAIIVIFVFITDNFILMAKSDRVKRVVGGSFVHCGHQPRVASLRKIIDLKHRCGATLLSPQFALTAAHCVLPPNDYVLILNNLCQEEGQTPSAQVLQVFVHELYDVRSRAHDIALLRVSLHLNDTRWLGSAGDVLPRSSFGLSGECAIFGYGSKYSGSTEWSDQLHAGNVELVSLDFCTEILGPIAPELGSGMMCAVGPADTCQGDSGSPLVCDSLVEGISSYGQSCGAAGVPAVYTSVAAHSDWIHHVMENR